MKYKIGICDDEAVFREEIRELCEKLALESELSFSYSEFGSKAEVLSHEGELDFLFLDIQMEGERDGIEIMEALETKGNVRNLFFLSSHEEQMMHTFSDITKAFIPKPPVYERIKKEIEKRIRKEQSVQTIAFHESGEDIVLPVREVIYLEGEGSYIRLITREKSYTLCATLGNWEKELVGKNFIRIHKSFLVNATYIAQMKDKVFLKERSTGEASLPDSLPIGRKYKETAREIFKQYKMKELMGGK